MSKKPKRTTVAQLAVRVLAVESRLAATQTQLAALRKRSETDDMDGNVFAMRHASDGVQGTGGVQPNTSLLAAQYVHYRLPQWMSPGGTRPARVTGPGRRGGGYINLTVELNGDENDDPRVSGVLWLIVTDVPYDNNGGADTWRFGSFGAPPEEVRR